MNRDERDETFGLDTIFTEEAQRFRKPRSPLVENAAASAVPRLNAARNYDDVRDIMSDFTAAVACSCFTFFCGEVAHDTRRIPGTVFRTVTNCLHNYPAAWVQTYYEREYHRVDPVMRDAPQSLLAIKWRDFRHKVPRDSEAFLQEAARHGLATGISVPIHGYAGLFSVLSLAWAADTPDVQRQIDEMEHGLHLVALQLHAAALRLCGPWTAEHPMPKVSPREKEVLKWAAIGKSNSEIGEILGISDRTVKEHLDRVAHKLGVRTKIHAVVEAVALGLTRA